MKTTIKSISNRVVYEDTMFENETELFLNALQDGFENPNNIKDLNLRDVDLSAPDFEAYGNLVLTNCRVEFAGLYPCQIKVICINCLVDEIVEDNPNVICVDCIDYRKLNGLKGLYFWGFEFRKHAGELIDKLKRQATDDGVYYCYDDFGLNIKIKVHHESDTYLTADYKEIDLQDLSVKDVVRIIFDNYCNLYCLENWLPQLLADFTLQEREVLTKLAEQLYKE